MHSVFNSAGGRYGDRDWQTVSAYVPHRNGQQCMLRYTKVGCISPRSTSTTNPFLTFFLNKINKTKVLDPNIRHGRWSDEELGLLQRAVELYGEHSWARVAQMVPGRTDSQCRERFVNVQRPGLRRGPFTPEEDALLLDGVEAHGFAWATIARQAFQDARSDSMLKQRFYKLRPAESREHLQRKKIRVRVTPTNRTARDRTQLTSPDLLAAIGEQQLQAQEDTTNGPRRQGRAGRQRRRVADTHADDDEDNGDDDDDNDGENDDNGLQQQQHNVSLLVLQRRPPSPSSTRTRRRRTVRHPDGSLSIED